MKGLTERQREILDYISAYISSYGRSPTLREIGNAFGFSPNAAHDAVDVLVGKGFLVKSPKGLRSLAFPLSERMERENIPIVFFPSEPSSGDIEEERSSGRIYVPRFIAEAGAFAFRVTSESMLGAGILPGDTAIMAKTGKAPAEGDIILASYSYDDAPLELRRYHRIGELYAELWPENDSMGIIKVPATGLITAGVLVHIRRDYIA